MIVAGDSPATSQRRVAGQAAAGSIRMQKGLVAVQTSSAASIGSACHRVRTAVVRCQRSMKAMNRNT